MHNHGSMGGPFRGSPSWWQGTASPIKAEEPISTTPELPPEKGNIRWDLVRRIKQEIAQGKYDSPEKWDAALDRLLDDFA